ncbi:Glycoside hydrolase, superfamily [Niveomyces insectorum RCEF 264]|uniref:beta-glucosidase n=1 Tax=Niveomyces insectorum RCEF 264 TaxID=1081102 RepID=A0A167MH02_9HYPO|nr:Glycoside hydrolase, superfamily [Niveomyces insectorum RCEF 264]
MTVSSNRLLAAIAGLLPALVGADTVPIYKNASYSPEARAADLVPRLSWAEKIQQLNGAGLMSVTSPYSLATFENTTAKENGWISYGIRLFDSVQAVQISNEARENWANRSLVPMVIMTDSVNGPYTAGGTLFPPTISFASTFNIDLFGDAVAVMRDENMAIGTRWVLSPELDVPKDPRYGRIPETYGEDPFLVGRFGLKYVDTMQELDEDGYIKVAVTMKHFIYGNPNGGINLASQYGGLNYLYNNLFPPFIKIINEANPPPQSVMVSYASVDRMPMTANKYLLQDHLRQKIGFKGLYMSDSLGVAQLQTYQFIANSPADAGLKALRAGVQLELGAVGFPPLINKANDSEVVDLVNRAVQQFIEIKIRTGTFDQPLPTVEGVKATLRAPAHLATNHNVSREAIVLLTNQNNTLPLPSGSPSKTGKIALLGPMANVLVAGTYAANNSTDKAFGNALLQSLQNEFGAGNIVYQPAVDFVDKNDSSGIAPAVAAAKEAGLAILSLGSLAVQKEDPLKPKNTNGELFTHAEMEFPGLQQDLLDAVLDAGVPTILVITGGPAFVLKNSTLSRTGAIVHSLLAGEYTSDSVVEILTGKVNPSGKLPVSLPETSGSIPVAYDYLPSDGLTWTYPGTSRAVLFPFGYGLSYSTFEFGTPNVALATTPGGEPTVNVTVTVTNSGKVDGKEVVQVYFRQQYTSIETPTKRLIEFTKVDIPAGSKQDVTFSIKVDDLGYYVNGDWTWESGNYTFFVGSSSRDEDLQPVSITL